MNTLEAIAARRSIRKFKSDPIPEDMLQKILTAGIQAPSGKNRQPWRFIVVQGEKRAEMIRTHAGRHRPRESTRRRLRQQ